MTVTFMSMSALEVTALPVWIYVRVPINEH